MQTGTQSEGGRALVVDGVTHRYGSSTAVENINLDIRSGELVALLGPSGCGKTTLLRIIAGFIRQTEGRIILGDEVVDDLGPNRRRIGIVFQNYALFPTSRSPRMSPMARPRRAYPRPSARRRRNACSIW